MKRLSIVLFTLICVVHPTDAMDGKIIGHLISIPLIEGAGIYSSVKMIHTGETNATAAAITNLGLIGINAGIGAYTLFGKPDNYGTLRTVHRIAGFCTSAASIWLAVSAATTPDFAKVDKGVSMGYAVMTVVPLFLFKF